MSIHQCPIPANKLVSIAVTGCCPQNSHAWNAKAREHNLFRKSQEGKGNGKPQKMGCYLLLSHWASSPFPSFPLLLHTPTVCTLVSEDLRSGEGIKHLLLSQQLTGFPGECMPVALQHGMPFTQVLAPGTKLSQQTGGPGWYNCLCLGSVFLHSGEEMDGQWLYP